MFDLLVFVSACALIILGISLAVSIPIGRLLRRSDNLVAYNDEIDHAERIVLIGYLRECPYVTYVSARVWVVDSEGQVF